MSSSGRGRFLTALGAAVTLVLRPRSTPAQTSPAPSVATTAPHPTPSAASRAMAEATRRFDPALDDAQVSAIAAGIDGASKEGATLRGKHNPLHNGDEPVTTFATHIP